MLTEGMPAHQRRFDNAVSAFCGVPFPFPANAVGNFFVERNRNDMASDQNRAYPPFKPVDGIVGKQLNSSTSPGHLRLLLTPVIRYSAVLCKVNTIMNISEDFCFKIFLQSHVNTNIEKDAGTRIKATCRVAHQSRAQHDRRYGWEAGSSRISAR